MSAFGVSTLNRGIASALRAEVGSLRGATWTPWPRGARVILADGRCYFVHRICDDPGESGRVERLEHASEVQS